MNNLKEWINQLNDLYKSHQDYKFAFESTALDRDVWKNKYLSQLFNSIHGPVNVVDYKNAGDYSDELLCQLDFLKENNSELLKKRLDENITKNFDDSVDALLIGSEKCGTSWLFSLLRDNTNLFMGRKDLSLHTHLRDGNHIYSDLLFESRKPNSQAFLFDAELMLHPNSAIEVKRSYKNLKLILAVLRDPIDRALSEYKMRLCQGVEYLSFEDAIKFSDERKKYLPDVWFKWWAYLDRGLYWKQLEPYTLEFQSKILKIKIFESDIVLNARKLVDELLLILKEQALDSSNLQRQIDIGGKDIMDVNELAPTQTQIKFGLTKDKLVENLSYNPSEDVVDSLKYFYKEDLNNLQKYLIKDLTAYWPTSNSK